MEKEFLASGGEWREFLIGDLFDIQLSKGDNKPNELNVGTIPLVSAGESNNGIVKYISNGDGVSQKFRENILTADMFGNVFYQPKTFFAVSHGRINMLIPKDGMKLNAKIGLYISSSLRKLKSVYGFSHMLSSKKLQNEIVLLPSQNENPDLDFMENFISELQASRLRELQNYLKATGLSDYSLTEEEKRAVEALDKVEWKNFNVVDIFDVNNTHSILSSWIIPNSGTYPYVTAGESNNSISTYIDYDLSEIEKGNSIMIGGKTLVITYQEKDYFSNDSHNLSLYIKNEKGLEKKKQLFLVTSLFKSLKPLYSWGNSISKKKIQQDTFDLPIRNSEIDFEYMEVLIRAVQKLVIADVVKYADREMATYQQVVQ